MIHTTKLTSKQRAETIHFKILFADVRVVQNAKSKSEAESRSLPSLTISINSKDK